MKNNKKQNAEKPNAEKKVKKKINKKPKLKLYRHIKNVIKETPLKLKIRS